MPLLSELTTLRLGGPAGRFVVCDHEAALVAAVRAADTAGEPLLLLAGGSNLVVADEGFPGAVVRILTGGVERCDREERVMLTVAAGEPWDALVERCVREGLAGFECLSGIPGSVGATPIQNVGAYGQEVSETLVRVRTYDRARRAIVELEAAECELAYRSSIFKRTPHRWVVLAATFALERREQSKRIRYGELARALGLRVGDTASLADIRAAVLRLRRAKGMVLDETDPDTVSAGSFFLNPILERSRFELLVQSARERWGPDTCPPRFPQEDGRIKTSAAWLIERAGFRRGYGDPCGIAISSKHTLAITNRGKGTTAGLLALAEEIAAGVRREFGIELQPEPVFVGREWRPGAH